MNRPYIFCHMMMSLDGKIMGPYMDTPQGAAADGSSQTPSLFAAKDGLSTPQALGFTLQEAKVLDKGTVWLRYTIH